MNPKAVCDALAARLGVEIQLVEAPPGDPSAVVPPEQWHAACQAARRDEELFFDFLRAQTGIDYPDDGKIEVVAHLFSYRHRHAFVLKTRVDRKDPKLATVEDVWPAANWYEREIWDLLGVVFEGHSDLRRLVLPQDWVGHPLRKDYQEQEHYQGIPTVRPGYPKFEPGGKKKKKDRDAEKADRPKKEAKPAAEETQPAAAEAKPAEAEVKPAAPEAEPAAKPEDKQEPTGGQGGEEQA